MTSARALTLLRRFGPLAVIVVLFVIAFAICSGAGENT